jgi:hypothetical protein
MWLQAAPNCLHIEHFLYMPSACIRFFTTKKRRARRPRHCNVNLPHNSGIKLLVVFKVLVAASGCVVASFVFHARASGIVFTEFDQLICGDVFKHIDPTANPMDLDAVHESAFS